MSTHARALLIGMFGPALQAVGLVWDLLAHAVFAQHGGDQFTLRHILIDPAHLIIVVGLLLSVICIPLALQVAGASPQELEIPDLDSEEAAGAIETWGGAE